MHQRCRGPQAGRGDRRIRTNQGSRVVGEAVRMHDGHGHCGVGLVVPSAIQRVDQPRHHKRLASDARVDQHADALALRRGKHLGVPVDRRVQHRRQPGHGDLSPRRGRGRDQHQDGARWDSRRSQYEQPARDPSPRSRSQEGEPLLPRILALRDALPRRSETRVGLRLAVGATPPRGIALTGSTCRRRRSLRRSTGGRRQPSVLASRSCLPVSNLWPGRLHRAGPLR